MLALALFGAWLCGCDLLYRPAERPAFQYKADGGGSGALMTVFSDVDLPLPSLQNIAAKNPSFVLTSGQLPPGLKLDENTGKIAGVPLKPGQFSATIGLKIDDHTTLLTTPLVLRIDDQTLRYDGIINNVLTLESGAVLAPFSPPPIKLATGVTPHFAAIGPTSLPDGLLIDPDTGRISGTPTRNGVFEIKVGMTLHYRDRTRTYVVSVPCLIKMRAASSSSGGVRG